MHSGIHRDVDSCNITSFVGIDGSGDHYMVHSNRGGCAVFFFVARLKSFLAAARTSTGINRVISFLDYVHEGRKGLLMVFGGDGAHVNGMVGCVVVELSELCHGGLLSKFAKFLQPGIETVGLDKGSINDVGFGIMKHCHAQDVHMLVPIPALLHYRYYP
jgi:hypothetical protein